MVSNNSSTMPMLNDDGTLSAIVRDIQPVYPAGTLLRLWLPMPYDSGGGFGRFFLVRCTEDSPEARTADWSIYARRPLFCAGMPIANPDQEGSTWQLFVPNTCDPGYQWLLRRPRHSSVNLLGPHGKYFELTSNTLALLMLTDSQTLPLALPPIHTMLDRAGRVTLLIRGKPDDVTPLLPLIPIPVEVRIIATEDWYKHLSEPVRWADQLCAILPNSDYAKLAHYIRTYRFHLDDTFAHVFVTSDLICGVGACLVCVISSRDGGFTRSCVHGPVFPLTFFSQ